MIYDLQGTSYDLRFMRYEVRFTRYDLRGTIYDWGTLNFEFFPFFATKALRALSFTEESYQLALNFEFLLQTNPHPLLLP